MEKVKQHSHYLAKQIRNVIEPVTIRRNRLDLQNNPFYKQEAKCLSRVKDPKEWFFELTKSQSEFYDKIINIYFGDPDEGGQFKGAIYRPFEYEVEREKISGEKLTEKENFQFIQQRNLYDFMRRLMVKRFESSFGSFRQSIKNFKRITENVLKFIEKTNEYILDRALLEKIYNLDIEEIEKRLNDYTEKINKGDYPKNHKRYKVNDFIYKKIQKTKKTNLKNEWDRYCSFINLLPGVKEDTIWGVYIGCPCKTHDIRYSTEGWQSRRTSDAFFRIDTYKKFRVKFNKVISFLKSFYLWLGCRLFGWVVWKTWSSLGVDRYQ